MKTAKQKLIIFLVVALIQLSVPLCIIWQYENTLLTGKSFTWQTAPIDPYSPLKGRYLALNFKSNKAPIEENVSPLTNKEVYGLISTDANGQAFISNIIATKPLNDNYIKINNYNVYKGVASFSLPFNQYYINEDLAPKAEEFYRQSKGKNVTVNIRVKSGNAVIDNIYIDNKPIHEYLNN